MGKVRVGVSPVLQLDDPSFITQVVDVAQAWADALQGTDQERVDLQVSIVEIVGEQFLSRKFGDDVKTDAYGRITSIVLESGRCAKGLLAEAMQRAGLDPTQGRMRLFHRDEIFMDGTVRESEVKQPEKGGRVLYMHRPEADSLA